MGNSQNDCWRLQYAGIIGGRSSVLLIDEGTAVKVCVSVADFSICGPTETDVFLVRFSRGVIC